MGRAGFFVKRNFEERIVITPEEAGKFFASMDNKEMALFFNTVAEEVNKWPSFGSFPMQMKYLTGTKDLSDDARYVMQIIGEYSEKQ